MVRTLAVVLVLRVPRPVRVLPRAVAQAPPQVQLAAWLQAVVAAWLLAVLLSSSPSRHTIFAPSYLWARAVHTAPGLGVSNLVRIAWKSKPRVILITL